jgi:hypothetical protein
MVCQYGFIYLIYLTKYKKENKISFKFGMSRTGDINNRMKQHERNNGCNPIILLLIKTLSADYHESELKLILNLQFEKIPKTQEYYICNNIDDYYKIKIIIKEYFGLYYFYYNMNIKCNIHFDIDNNINYSFYDIEKLLSGDLSMPMEIS